MAAKMEKTRYPGIFRRGGRYVVTYRVRDERGTLVQKKRSAATLEEARRLKRACETDRDRGQHEALDRVSFREYAESWVDRYQGTGRQGFRESTRDDYRRLLRDFAYPFLDGRRRRRLSEVSTSDIADFIAWLCDPRAMAEHQHELSKQRAEAEGRKAPKPLSDDASKPFSDRTVRNVLNPVRSCLATAVREGKVRANPCVGAALPHRERVADEDEPEVRALSREQLGVLLAMLPERHRLFFRVLAATGSVCRS